MDQAEIERLKALSDDPEDMKRFMSLYKAEPDLILPYLFLGNAKHAKNAELLKLLKIDVVIQCYGTPDEKIEQTNHQYFSYQFEDLSTENISLHLLPAIQIIDESI